MRMADLVPTFPLALALLIPFEAPRASEEIAPADAARAGPDAFVRDYDVGAAFARSRVGRRLVVPRGSLILPHRPLVDTGATVAPGFGSGPSDLAAREPRGTPSAGLPPPDWLLDTMRDFLRAEALLAEPDDQVRLDGTTLRVRATREEHRRIAERLGLLTAASEPIRIEAVLAPAEVLNAAFPAWRAARADGLPVETFEKALADPRSRFFSLDARSGELVASGGRTIELFRSGDEVNQTGIVPV
mgnify:CR=1 FL=1